MGKSPTASHDGACTVASVDDGAGILRRLLLPKKIKGGCTPPSIPPASNLAPLDGFLLALAKAGLDTGANAGQHLLGRIRIGS